jgi:hypothetical protein
LEEQSDEVTYNNSNFSNKLSNSMVSNCGLVSKQSTSSISSDNGNNEENDTSMESLELDDFLFNDQQPEIDISSHKVPQTTIAESSKSSMPPLWMDCHLDSDYMDTRKEWCEDPLPVFDYSNSMLFDPSKEGDEKSIMRNSLTALTNSNVNEISTRRLSTLKASLEAFAKRGTQFSEFKISKQYPSYAAMNNAIKTKIAIITTEIPLSTNKIKRNLLTKGDLNFNAN